VKLYYLVAVAVVAVAVVLSAPILTSSKEDFSTYNTDWNGCSWLKESAKQNYSVADVFSLTDSLKGKERGVVILLNPNKSVSVSDDDVAALQRFVQNGGSLFIANDFGKGNDVLNRMGVGRAVIFNTSLLYDNSSYWAGGEYPVISMFSPNSSFTSNITRLYFNYGTALDVKDNSVTVLAKSSSSSYFVAPGQGNVSQGEKPVLAYVDYGKGKVVLLSDPSVFINSMDMVDNKKLFNNVVATLVGGDNGAQVLFDESHRAAPPLWSAAYYRIHADDTIKYALVLLTTALLVATVTVHGIRAQRKERPTVSLRNIDIDEDTIIGDIVKRHPKWAKERIKMVAHRLRTREREEENDDNR
jgi:hypothetical protein